MLSQETKDRIVKNAEMINKASEKYQLIHATFAIEKMFKDRMQSEYAKDIEEIRNQILSEKDDDKRKELFVKAREITNESNKKIKVLVDYIPQIKENSARITRTHGNTYMIVLPESMENIRKSDGTIDFDKLRRLRHLMAHELGHIVLHSGAVGNIDVDRNVVSEEEADYFADQLIEMRRIRNEEIHNNENYKNI